MRGSRIELFREIFLHHHRQISARAGAKLPQILRERPHVLIILLRIDLQRRERQAPLAPQAVERMFQQVALFDERIQQFQRASFFARLLAMGYSILLFRGAKKPSPSYSNFSFESSSPPHRSGGSFRESGYRKLGDLKVDP